MFMSMNKHILE